MLSTNLSRKIEWSEDLIEMKVTLKAPKGVLVSDEAVRMFQWICFISCEMVDVFGTGTNIVNIICFVKQGFKDPVNISLLGLAISDLGSLITLLWTTLCVIPAFQEADLPFETIEIQHLTAGLPHVVFTRVTSWITALITLERCLCIAMPLKVKNIITPRRTKLIITTVFVVNISSVFPLYYANRLTWKFSPSRNKTLLGLVYTDDKAIVEQISFAINNVLVPFTAFLLMILCTVVLVLKLHKQSQWRQGSTSVLKKHDTASDRDTRVAKMVVMISTLFIACFIPSGIVFLAMSLESDLNIGGKYENTLIIVYGICIFLESVNSSMNIFIYYHMSTRYRTVFRNLFSWN